MNIQITSRHSKVSQETQDFIRKELDNLEKYYDRITSCHVVIDNENIERTVEIVANIQGTTISAKAKSEHLGKSLDSAIQKITRQLKKVNEKVKNHKNGKSMPEEFNTSNDF